MSSGEHYTKFFFDTYALIEVFQGKEAYKPYLDAVFFVTKLNLFEFHQYLLRIRGPGFADAEIEKYLPHLRIFDLQVIKKASRLRKGRAGGVSMTDCIGYVYAVENGLIFLTGDRAFEGMEKVRFVT